MNGGRRERKKEKEREKGGRRGPFSHLLAHHLSTYAAIQKREV